jgi:Mlc titration factor MtfA (ptsG expression regulator)
MKNGAADGIPALRAGMRIDEWKRIAMPPTRTSSGASKRGRRPARTKTTRRRSTRTQADAPEEFFAVCSEVFFAAPDILRDEYPEYYAQLSAYYGQDPAARFDRLMESSTRH